MNNKKIIIVIFVLMTMLLSGCQKNSSEYSEFDNWYALYQYHLEDAENFKESHQGLQVNTYNWYVDIHDEEGVYLVNTSFFSKTLRDEWKKNNAYNNVPNRDIWYFVCSPNYLIDQGFEISEELIEEANNGTRIYLLPLSFSAEDFQNVADFLKETVSNRATYDTGLIPTIFNDNKDIKVVSYDNNVSLFTWPKKNEESFTDEACIYLCTPENMSYFESESLCACTYLTDTYLKFKNEYILNACLEKMPEDLVKDRLEFKTVSSLNKE